jgi:hypothetical protein
MAGAWCVAIAGRNTTSFTGGASMTSEEVLELGFGGSLVLQGQQIVRNTSHELEKLQDEVETQDKKWCTGLNPVQICVPVDAVHVR